MSWESSVERIMAGESLDREAARALIDAVMDSEIAGDELARLLLAWRGKGESVEEIAGAADSLRAHMIPIPTERRELVDTCGTGGDKTGTFNISTAAAIVTAACGVGVAKHGNRSITSRSGSADVLEQLGVRIDASPEEVGRMIDEIGIGFCFAPLVHPAMKTVAPVRRALGVPTIFNLLGPLCNPAGAPYQLVGVGNPDVVERLAKALVLLGSTRSWVVHGDDGLDEITCQAPTLVWEVADGRASSYRISPTDFGLAVRPWASAVADGPEQSAAIIRGVLQGEPGVARDLVVLNAAAAVRLARPDSPWPEICDEVSATIDAGKAQRKLDEWIEASRG